MAFQDTAPLSRSSEQPDHQYVSVSTMVSGLLGKVVSTTERFHSGKNNRVYRLKTSDSTEFVCKVYFEVERLHTEYAALTFLWRNGERAIPRPVVASEKNSCAIYEYVDGSSALPYPNEYDIDQAVEFLTRLGSYVDCDGSKSLPAAAEACPSVNAIVDNIHSRLSKLSEVQNQHEQLRIFLHDEFMPTLIEIESSLSTSGLSIEKELEQQEQTLSPSDFGFHNAIRRPDGTIVFLDFEYFGWDDPAKMISDFLLHPAMDIPNTLRARFYAGTITGLQKFGPVASRVKIVYPMFAMKWCMILLNEFVPEQLERREFSIDQPRDRGKNQLKQLQKARDMLSKVNNEYGFPYS